MTNKIRIYGKEIEVEGTPAIIVATGFFIIMTGVVIMVSKNPKFSAVAGALCSKLVAGA